ncbi:MAG: tRNA pseudouridine(55) synthase TruB [Desulfofustis sp.]|nr:tRNA pseudouridine(55) synthase TruB [Desulfofustis sp.]
MSFQADPGVVLVDKLSGRTSFSVVRSVRKIFGVKKVGHAGTLDPFASGLLVVCIGRPATRLIETLMEGKKTYQATVVLGKISTTQDPEGEISEGGPVSDIGRDAIEVVLKGFRGTIMQTPPYFSALKHKGKPLYHYARKGIAITKEPREVTIYELEMTGLGLASDGGTSLVELRINCTKGTYIRSLAEDIGNALGCGAYLSALRRTRSGCFTVAESIPGDILDDPDRVQWVRQQRIDMEQLQNLLQSC